VASQVIMEDGSEGQLSDHLREVHRKGTRGLTDEYLSGLHQTLHQRKREPEHEHGHPDNDEPGTEYGEDAEDDTPATA
jgi:hypothetical protein